jgi:hypothetical protein
MATRVKTEIYWSEVYGLTLRVDGTVRQYVKDVSEEIANQGKINLIANSKARHFGYRRTGNLGRSIKSRYRWANQHGCGYEITMRGRGTSSRPGVGRRCPSVASRGS